ncbi:MAG: hypothetical protein AAF235_06715 [Planctomycetota bacterium]
MTAYEMFTGTVSEKVAVDVHARVSGVLPEVRYDSGDVVGMGDPLFLIDPEPSWRSATRRRPGSARWKPSTTSRRQRRSALSGRRATGR